MIIGYIIIVVSIFLAAGGIGFALVRFLRQRSDTMMILQQQMENFRGELRNNLENNIKVIQEANRNMGERLETSSKVLGEVHNRLGHLDEATKKVYDVGKDIASLQDILRAPKLRGGIGELFLEDLLSQMLPTKFFSIQHEFKDRTKVDAVIRIGDKMVSVDAKFPLEDFRRMIDASTEDEKQSSKRLFNAGVKRHIEAVSKYIKPEEGTYDFALMYIPAENVYYETIIKDDALDGGRAISTVALSKKVIPVSPNNLYIYLYTILLGLKGLQVEKDIEQVLATLSRLRVDFGRFSKDFSLVGKHITNARGSYEEAEKRVGRFEERLAQLDLPEEKSLPLLDN